MSTSARAPLVFAYATFILVGLNSGAGGVLLPQLIDAYHVDKATIGLTFFAFSAGYMLAGSLAGALVHRAGTRTALALGTGVYVVTGLAVASQPPFVLLVGLHVLLGFAGGTMETVLNAYVSSLPSAASRMNRMHAFFGVGALLGPLLAAWLLTFATWPWVWVALAGICAVMLTGIVITFPGHTPAPVGDDVPRGGLLGAALRVPAIVAGAAFLAIYVGLEISVGNWGFSFLMDQRALSELLAGYTISGYWLGLTLGRFLITPIAGRAGIGPAGSTFICLAGVIASGLLVWGAPLAAVTTAGLVLLGFFLGPIFPTTMAVVPGLIGGRLVPSAIGLITGFSVVGGSVLPWLAGYLAQRVGLWTLFPLVLLLAFVLVGLWRVLAARMRTAVPAEA